MDEVPERCVGVWKNKTDKWRGERGTGRGTRQRRAGNGEVLQGRQDVACLDGVANGDERPWADTKPTHEGGKYATKAAKSRGIRCLIKSYFSTGNKQFPDYIFFLYSF